MTIDVPGNRFDAGASCKEHRDYNRWSSLKISHHIEEVADIHSGKWHSVVELVTSWRLDFVDDVSNVRMNPKVACPLGHWAPAWSNVAGFRHSRAEIDAAGATTPLDLPAAILRFPAENHLALWQCCVNISILVTFESMDLDDLMDTLPLIFSLRHSMLRLFVRTYHSWKPNLKSFPGDALAVDGLGLKVVLWVWSPP